MQTTFARQNFETPSSSVAHIRNGGVTTSVTAAPKAGPVAVVASGGKSRSQVVNGNGTKGLVEALINSRVYQEYERAFTEATDLPVTLRAVESWQLPHHGKRNESPFCDLMAQKSRACGACLQVQEELSEGAVNEPYTAVCPHIQGIEVTQAIQHYRSEEHLTGLPGRAPDNSIRMIAGKPAWVRVYVRSGVAVPMVFGVTGELEVLRDTGGMTYSPVTKLAPRNGPIVAWPNPTYATERTA